MIDWSTVAPAVKALFEGLATTAPVDPSFEGRWTDRSAEFIHPAVQKDLILKVTRVRDVGADRVLGSRTVTPSAGDPYEVLDESIVGMKEFVIEVRVESHDHSEELSRWSWSMLERIRTGLLFSRALAALKAVNVGLVEIGPGVDVSFTFDRRRVNAASCEITMNAGFVLTDSVPLNWFERVVLTSQFKSPADVVLPSPPNITDETYPPEE